VKARLSIDCYLVTQATVRFSTYLISPQATNSTERKGFDLGSIDIHSRSAPPFQRKEVENHTDAAESVPAKYSPIQVTTSAQERKKENISSTCASVSELSLLETIDYENSK
jgi:hypothetical protein